jgi:hypothetical protein
VSTEQHTPGPWKVIPPGHGHATEYLCVQFGADETYTSLELKPADARLCAAAPELLAALKRLEATVKPDLLPHDKGCGCVVHEARAAIAKAEGRSHE